VVTSPPFYLLLPPTTRLLLPTRSSSSSSSSSLSSSLSSRLVDAGLLPAAQLHLKWLPPPSETAAAAAAAAAFAEAVVAATSTTAGGVALPPPRGLQSEWYANAHPFVRPVVPQPLNAVALAARSAAVAATDVDLTEQLRTLNKVGAGGS
jgi:hypothetical protein